MDILKFKTTIETLGGLNVNGQYDQVINDIKTQLQILQTEQEKRIEEEWGLTLTQYDEVVKYYNSIKFIPNPLELNPELNNKQMKLFSHLCIENQSFDILRIDSDGYILTNEEACQTVRDNLSDYININKIVDDNFRKVDEEELCIQLIENRDREFETDEDGNILHDNELENIISNN